MIYIGICDDEKEYREKLHDIVSTALFRFDEMEFSHYDSGREVIEAIEADAFPCELLLLDIHMPEKDGLETAAYIRDHQIDVDIIFVTVSSEFVFDGYTFQAFSYLLKPLSRDRLSAELSRYMQLRSACSKCLYVNIGRKRVPIFLDRVKYFAAEGRKINVIQKSDSQSLSFYAKMGELEQTLSEDDFIRCHQSYLVNVRYIQSHTRTEIDIGGEIIPISRRYTDIVCNYLENERGGQAIE